MLIPSLYGESKAAELFLKIVGETKVLANHVILNKQVAMKVATLHKIKGPLRLQEFEAQVCWLLHSASASYIA